jgi:hypothetical protein
LIQVIESTGLLCDGRLLALNSYENRVYQVGIEDSQPLITKVYRPGRWTDEQILEEHAFALEIADAEIPLIPPMEINGKTLHEHDGFRFAMCDEVPGQSTRSHSTGKGVRSDQQQAHDVNALKRGAICSGFGIGFHWPQWPACLHVRQVAMRRQPRKHSKPGTTTLMTAGGRATLHWVRKLTRPCVLPVTMKAKTVRPSKATALPGPIVRHCGLQYCLNMQRTLT